MAGITTIFLLSLLIHVRGQQQQDGCDNPCDVHAIRTCNVQQCRELIKSTDRSFGCKQAARLSVISNKSRGRLPLTNIDCDCSTGNWYGSIDHATFVIPAEFEVQCVPNPRFTGDVDMAWYTVDIVITAAMGIIILVAIVIRPKQALAPQQERATAKEKQGGLLRPFRHGGRQTTGADSNRGSARAPVPPPPVTVTGAESTTEADGTTTGMTTTGGTSTDEAAAGAAAAAADVVPLIPVVKTPSKETLSKERMSEPRNNNNNNKSPGRGATVAAATPTKQQQQQQRNSDRRKARENPAEQGAYGRLRQRIEDRKIARETARQQEKNFLEYRKIMILYEYKPTTKALAKPADDYFPKRKFSFKDMAFGARKSYFLSLRPNSKFANWHGKKKEQEQMEQEKVLNLRTKAKTMMVATAAAQEQKALDEAHAAQKIAAEDAAGMMDDQIRQLDKVAKESVSYGTEPPHKGDEVKGTRAMMPMAKGADGRRTFFWISCEGKDEVTDEDCPIDSDKVQEVIDGKLLLKVAEFGRREFNPYDKLDVLRKLNKLCERETYMMSNTLMSVLRLFDMSKQGDGKKDKDKTDKRKDKNADEGGKARKITWLETIDEYNGQGCMMRLNGRGVPDSELEKKILPLTLHYRE
ncbi:hypothetical protein PRIPAC_90823 [Pristionchus pacificus]|uniref:Uncharacterized protein n=1 Tax=Pristionchus pacificus TaxID=54126 RepID=A0A2A6CZL8_PRIPA|nr:hypothetical protein PRIPAC_90823 [Pristionchus pacificus]|eukprot:PDM83473.1 hypothetical protein PRIPAC_35105 [Pristionchus pacificus]